MSIYNGGNVFTRPSTGGGGGDVSTVFGRNGTVLAVAGDYDATKITNTPAGNLAAVTVQAALAELDAEKIAISSITDNFKGIDSTLVSSQNGTHLALNSLEAHASLYVDPYGGNDSGTGSRSNPFLTVQVAIDSFTAGEAAYVIYVMGSTTGGVTLRALDTNIAFVFDVDTEHTGTITLVDGNDEIYFVAQNGSCLLIGTIDDGSQGDIYYSAVLTNTYNKTGGSGSASPNGDVRFLSDCHLSGTVINLSGNSSMTALGYGNIGVLTHTNGVFAARHNGTMLCPVLSGGSSTTGMPILLIQGNIQLIKNGTDDALTCTATFAVVFLATCSTLQGDLSTFGKINFTGSQPNVYCRVWAGVHLASSGDVFPSSTGAILSNYADYMAANRTGTNYTGVATASVTAHLSAIDTALISSVITDATTSRTLSLTDANDYLRFTSTSDTTVTVPLNADVTFEVGTRVDVFRAAVGNVTFAAVVGVTINSAEGLKIAAEKKGSQLIYIGADTWDLVGALAA